MSSKSKSKAKFAPKYTTKESAEEIAERRAKRRAKRKSEAVAMAKARREAEIRNKADGIKGHFSARYTVEQAQLWIQRYSQKVTYHRGDTCETPLHDAVSSNRVDLIPILLAAGAQLDAGDVMDYTPVHFAVSSGRIAVLHALLLGSDLSILRKRNGNSDEPIHLAIRDRDLTMISCLLDYYPYHLTNLDSCGRTLIQQIMKLDDLHRNLRTFARSEPGYKTDSIEVTDLFFFLLRECQRLRISQRAFINQVNKDGDSNLHLVTTEGHWSILTEMLILGVQHMEYPDYFKRTPIFYAISKGNWRIVELFISEGANLEHPDVDEITPIAFSIREQQWKIFRIFRAIGDQALLRIGLTLKQSAFFLKHKMKFPTSALSEHRVLRIRHRIYFYRPLFYRLMIVLMQFDVDEEETLLMKEREIALAKERETALAAEREAELAEAMEAVLAEEREAVLAEAMESVND